SRTLLKNNANASVNGFTLTANNEMRLQHGVVMPTSLLIDNVNTSNYTMYFNRTQNNLTIKDDTGTFRPIAYKDEIKVKPSTIDVEYSTEEDVSDIQQKFNLLIDSLKTSGIVE